MSSPAASWFAARLLSLATRMTPHERREWGDAMRAEADYLPAAERLGWAFGSLIAAIKLRITPLKTGNFRINRWVMLIEVLGCFVPALLAWWEFAFGPSGVVRLNPEIIDKVFMSNPGGPYILGLMIGFSVSGLVAPIGLYLGLRYVMLGRGLSNRALGITLVAAPVLQSLAGTFGMFVIGTDGWGTGLQLFVLLTVLPVLGILHLMYLAKAGTTPADTRLAAN